MSFNRSWVFVFAFCLPGVSYAATNRSEMSEKLTKIRTQVLGLEQDLIDSLKTQKEAHQNISKIRQLLKLQKEEKQIGKKRLDQLEATIKELEDRRSQLKLKVSVQKETVRHSLREIYLAMGEMPRSLRSLERESLDAVRRQILANMTDRGLKEIEVIRIDLSDADHLEQKIQEERAQLAFVFNDLKEQESVLELNQQLQADLLRKKHHERLSQLENYRKLKSSENQVEHLIQQFNSRIELENVMESERQAALSMGTGAFSKLKGKLSLPVPGSILTQFGRVFDPSSNLFVFKKGVDISSNRGEVVKAVSAGKVAFSGELPNYGKVAIVDHGDHFYSLVAHLGNLQRKTGDAVGAGDPIGIVDDNATPIYFEIRSRNVAVNPLQWMSN